MKILSWALMLVGLLCVALAIYLRAAPLVLGGGIIMWIGEIIPRSLSHRITPPAARPEVRRTVEVSVPKPQEKSA